jgi:PAS domain S-box-containing protein
MPPKKPMYEELEKIVKELKEKVISQRKYFEEWRNEAAKGFRTSEAFKATANLIEINLDDQWRILSHSNNMLLLSENIVGLRQKRAHIKELIGEKEFTKVLQYQQKINECRSLSFGEGKEWELKYSGPDETEQIGKDWLPFSSSSLNQWSIENGKILHKPHATCEEDFYLMTAVEYGCSDEDVKVICIVKTSKDKKLIRDVSIVLSGASSILGIYPDMVGYTACSGATDNREGRIQRNGGILVAIPEQLEPDTEYLITAERTGGRLRRELVNLKTGEKGATLEAVDTNAEYGKYNHLGFTTFAGELEISEIKIFTRRSSFQKDQFDIPCNIDIGLKDSNDINRIYQIKIGETITETGPQYIFLMEDITERKEAEKKLQAREAFLDRVIEQSPFAIWISDAQGTLQHANPALKRFLNLSDEQLVGKYNVLKDPIVERQGFLPLIRTVYEEGKSINFSGEWDGNDIPTLDLKNSNSVSVELTMFPIHNTEGELTNVVTNWINITERKQAEDALRESEERLRNILETSLDIAYKLNLATGTYEYLSPAIEILFGYAAEDFTYMGFEGFEERFHPEDRLRYAEHFDKLLSHSVEENIEPIIEYRWMHRDGEYRWFSDSRVVIFDDDKTPISVIGAVRDVTESKHGEEKLKRAYAELDQIFNSTSPMNLIGIDFNVLRVSDKYCDVFGKKKDSLIGKKCYEVLSGSYCHTDKCPLSQILEGKERLKFESKRKIADGRERVFETTVTPHSPYRD